MASDSRAVEYVAFGEEMPENTTPKLRLCSGKTIFEFDVNVNSPGHHSRCSPQRKKHCVVFAIAVLLAAALTVTVVFAALGATGRIARVTPNSSASTSGANQTKLKQYNSTVSFFQRKLTTGSSRKSSTSSRTTQRKDGARTSASSTGVSRTISTVATTTVTTSIGTSLASFSTRGKASSLNASSRVVSSATSSTRTTVEATGGIGGEKESTSTLRTTAKSRLLTSTTAAITFNSSDGTNATRDVQQQSVAENSLSRTGTVSLAANTSAKSIITGRTETTLVTSLFAVNSTSSATESEVSSVTTTSGRPEIQSSSNGTSNLTMSSVAASVDSATIDVTSTTTAASSVTSRTTKFESPMGNETALNASVATERAMTISSDNTVKETAFTFVGTPTPQESTNSTSLLTQTSTIPREIQQKMASNSNDITNSTASETATSSSTGSSDNTSPMTTLKSTTTWLSSTSANLLSFNASFVSELPNMLNSSWISVMTNSTELPDSEVAVLVTNSSQASSSSTLSSGFADTNGGELVNSTSSSWIMRSNGSEESNLLETYTAKYSYEKVTDSSKESTDQSFAAQSTILATTSPATERFESDLPEMTSVATVDDVTTLTLENNSVQVATQISEISANSTSDETRTTTASNVTRID